MACSNFYKSGELPFILFMIISLQNIIFFGSKLYMARQMSGNENKIKVLRKELGLRQEDVANKLGVTRQTIIAIEMISIIHLWN